MLDVWVLRLANPDGEDPPMQQLSVLRLLRVLRVVRMVRFLRAFKELWVIVKGILDSFRPMLWISLLLFLVLYVCSILCVSIIGKKTDLYPGHDVENVAEWAAVADFNNFEFFGTVPRA